MRRFFDAGGYSPDRLPIHFKSKRPEIIRGPKSKRLKYRSSICQVCNNDRSGSFDRAYDRLSDWLMGNQSRSNLGLVSLPEVFGADYDFQIDNLRRYCAKALGCRIVDSNSELPSYFPNPVTGANLGELAISVCRLERFRSLRNYRSALFDLNLSKGDLYCNIVKSLKATTGRQLVRNAIWWEGIGHFQINYWFAIAHHPALGFPLSPVTAEYQILESELDEAGLKAAMWDWLAEHPTDREMKVAGVHQLLTDGSR